MSVFEAAANLRNENVRHGAGFQRRVNAPFAPQSAGHFIARHYLQHRDSLRQTNDFLPSVRCAVRRFQKKGNVPFLKCRNDFFKSRYNQPRFPRHAQEIPASFFKKPFRQSGQVVRISYFTARRLCKQVFCHGGPHGIRVCRNPDSAPRQTACQIGNDHPVRRDTEADQTLFGKRPARHDAFTHRFGRFPICRGGSFMLRSRRRRFFRLSGCRFRQTSAPGLS